MAGKEKNERSLKKISLIVGIAFIVLTVLWYCGTFIYKAAQANAQIVTTAESCLKNEQKIEKLKDEKADKITINKRLTGIEKNMETMSKNSKEFQDRIYGWITTGVLKTTQGP